jgi:hypothetical protein
MYLSSSAVFADQRLLIGPKRVSGLTPRDVCFWPEADMKRRVADFRFRGVKRTRCARFEDFRF